MSKVKINRSLKRRSVSIQILPDTSIVVSVPYFFSNSSIEKLLKEKEEWIKEKQRQIQEKNIQKKFLPGEVYFYLGKKYQLAFRQNKVSLIEIADKLYVSSHNPRNIKLYLTSWYKQKARKIIQERVHHYAKISGSEFTSIMITSAETRWGSCSSEKNLHFNWRLVMAPMPVIDYVVAHELSHLEEMNHSRRFWERVRKIFPIYREYRTWLKRYGHMLVI